ncbi:MAG: sugar kinase [Hyphomicrobiales bacterium]
MKFVSIGECMVEFAQSNTKGMWVRNFAGDTFNTAWYFKKLAKPDWQTAYFTCVGDDKVSDELLGFIAGAGVEIDQIAQLPGKSPGLYSIELDGAERSFSYWRDSSAARELAGNPDLLAKVLADAQEVYFSGITIAILNNDHKRNFIDALSAARKSGTSVSFDPNIRPRLWSGPESICHWTHEAAKVSSRVFPTHDDEADLFSDKDLHATADRYQNLGAEEIVVKNGPAPCLAVSGNEQIEVSATKVAHPVDTTGAGDSFNAGYLAARCSGETMANACRFAHNLSASVITHHGALIPESAVVALKTG